MMKRAWLWLTVSFLTGLLLGTGLALALRPAAAGAKVAGADRAPRTVAPSSDSNPLLERIREQEKELAGLRAQLASLTEAEPDGAAQPSEEEQIEPGPGFAGRMEARMAARVDELVSAYGLTEEQRSLLEEVYRERFENFRARRRGESVEPFNLDAAIEEILTEEQFAGYLEDSQEEIYNRAELIAVGQLVRLQQEMEFQPGQEDLLYDTIHYTAQEMLIARQTGEEFDMRAVMGERLGTILTEEQMAAVEDVLGRGGPGMGRGGGP